MPWKISRSSTFAFLFVAASCSDSSGGADLDSETGSASMLCQTDFDCKGDRICQEGMCVDPSSDTDPGGDGDPGLPTEPTCFDLNGAMVCAQAMDPAPSSDEMLSGTVPVPNGEIPSAASLNLAGFTIRNQSACGSCVAFAARSAMGLRSTVQANQFVDFSPAHIWHIAGYGSDNCDTGSFMSQVFADNQNLGEHVVPEPVWPYDISDPEGSLDLVPLAPVLDANGLAHLESFVVIDQKDSQQIKHAIVQSWPPVISVPVYQNDWVAGDIDIPSDDDTFRGYHAIVVVGYDDGTSRFRFANSWGTGFGEQGFGTLSYDFIEQYGRGGIALQQLDINDSGAVCGDGTCDNAESQASCCLDCGCPGGSACEAGSCVLGSMCGDGSAAPGESCDGADLKGQTCMAQGFDSGTLSCKVDCSYDTTGCCSDECEVGVSQCVDADSISTCGQLDQDSCFELGAAQSCTQGQVCSIGECGCADGDDGEFTIQAYEYPNFGPVGCSADGTLKLKAAAEMINPTTLRIHVRKQDDTAFGSPATLSLYVGDGPTCPNPANVVKATKAVQVNVIDQTIDLTVNPYGAAWALNETKQFWVGKDEGGFNSFRATNMISVKRNCIP